MTRYHLELTILEIEVEDIQKKCYLVSKMHSDL